MIEATTWRWRRRRLWRQAFCTADNAAHRADYDRSHTDAPLPDARAAAAAAAAALLRLTLLMLLTMKLGAAAASELEGPVCQKKRTSPR